MTITLSPELEAVIKSDIESGHFGSAEDYVSEAIKAFHGQREWLDEQRAKIETGWQESERDEGISAEQLLKNMKTWKAELEGLRKTA